MFKLAAVVFGAVTVGIVALKLYRKYAGQSSPETNDQEQK
jgi:hypothetical protein